MHLGNARTSLLAWLDARARGGRVLLRIEDLDRDRCRPEYADAIRRDLAWLGLDWDDETPPQSQRGARYDAAIEQLAAAGHVYECFCTRRELAVASAPHGAEGESPPCPGTCRGLAAGDRARLRGQGRRPALRVRMPAPPLTFHDRLHGDVTQSPAAAGDPVVRRSDGLHAYQLAVVVDDAADAVSDVVRGDDLLASTCRQAALGQLLSLPAVSYAHVPLVLGGDGARLAKRHGAVSLQQLRAAGAGPKQLAGWLAEGAGTGDGSPAAPAELVDRFRLEAIERRPLTLDAGALAALAGT